MIWDKIYTLDWKALGVHLLPIDLRKPKMAGWIQCLLKPIANLHTQFINFRRITVYKIDHTSQVFSLEKVLNDAFDQQERRIYIVDGVYRSALYFYNPDENEPIHFYNQEEDNAQYFYNPSELQNLDVDFVVVLPQSFGRDASRRAVSNEINAQELRIRALVDFYRLPDKTYEFTYE